MYAPLHFASLLYRCVDPVDIVVFQDSSKASDLIPKKANSLLGYIAMKDANSAKYVIQASQSV